MRILMLSAEVEPFAKVGGLADVAGSLPKALVGLGHDARVVMPAYGMVVSNPQWAAKKVLGQFPVRMNKSKTVLADLYEIKLDGVTFWLVDGDTFFAKIERSEEIYSPGRDAYLFFAQASLEAAKAMGWRPDVVHANDWHTAFAPVFLKTKFEWPTTAGVYTIHNLAYQGEFGPDTIEAAGLPWSLFNMHQLETWGGVNFIKSGCVFADQVNTVSPTYCEEIQTEAFGCRLQGLMAHLASEGRLRGILNGIDVEKHDPETDPRIPAHFSATDREGKRSCKASLIQDLNLQTGADKPLFSVISRLSDQKGFDMIADALERIIELGAQLTILAIGDPAMAVRLRALETQFPGDFRFVEAYDAELAQRLYAASDLFLMPSSFEPCGLGQMFAMRYGSVPIVRKTGGLADTVFEGENGFVFENRSAFDMVAAIDRAVTAYHSDNWNSIVGQAMGGDYSWAKSAKKYIEMYSSAFKAQSPLLVAGN